MKLMDHIHEVRAAKRHEKKSYVIVMSALVCAAFFVLWIFYFASLTGISASTGKVAENSNPEGISFFDTVKTGGRDLIGAIKGYFKN